MKKVFIIITIVLLTICLTGISIYAQAEQASFYNSGFGINKTIDGSEGKVIINIPEDTEDEIGMIVQGMVRNLDPNEEYYVYLWAHYITGWYMGDLPLGRVGSWFRFAMITTNVEGHANFHININTEDLLPGTYDISVWIDEVNVAPPYPHTMYPTVLVSDEIEVNIQ